MLPLSIANFQQARPVLGQGLTGSVISGGVPQVANTAQVAPLAQSFPTQAESPIFNMMVMMMQLMQQMISMMLGQSAQQSAAQQPATQAQQPFGNVLNSNPAPASTGYGSTPAPAPAAPATPAPTTSTPATGGAYGGGSTGAVSNANFGNAAPLTQDDYTNYVLASTRGGTSMVDEGIFARYSDPNSRFATAGANEFDAVTAKIYAGQFKAYAMGEDVVFTPGKDVNQIAGNIAKGNQTPMTQEAELIAHVAAVYRGDFGNQGAYNNPALKQLLVSWGRNDIANQAGVGDGDVQSVGGVIKALNEERDPAVRQAWIQQIFDFQNNTPTSPSGAVPNVESYQNAVAMVQGGAFDQLLQNYTNGVRTNGSIELPNGRTINPNGGTEPAINPANTGFPPSNFDRNMDFTQLTPEQRTQLGQSNTDRAVSHLGGRQLISTGSFGDNGNGHVYNNVLANPNGFTAEEVRLVNQWRQEEMATDGFVSGRRLQEEFLKQYSNHVGTDLTSRYANSPQTRLGPISDRRADLTNDLATLQQRTGLSADEQHILRVGGHEPLLGGSIDGQYLLWSLNNPNSLDSPQLSPSRDANGNFITDANGNVVTNGSQAAMEALLRADMADDGRIDGSSTRRSLLAVLDKSFGVGQGVNNISQVEQEAQQIGQANGRSIQQISQDMTQGVSQALSTAAQFVKNHPVATAVGVGGMAAATAVCPFLGGMAVGGAGIAAAQKFMNR